jgi:8-oxo-dGTP pyrophosphatase MutT (NUDIX family)
LADPLPNEQLRKLIVERLRDSVPVGDPARAWIGGLAPEESADLRKWLPATLARAAVMVPIVERPGGLFLLLTQRASHLKNHPGQISFPGGRIEAADAGPWEAALRETEEEIGLPRRHVSLAGYLQDHLVISGYLVTPVVAFVRPDFELRLDVTEVEEVFEVPLTHVLDRRNHVMQTRQYFGHAFVSYDIPYQGHNIWGATAGMLMSLCRVLEEH